MPGITAIFWDIGGVLLSNAWDHSERSVVLQQFGLTEEEFHSRHEMLVDSFERGKVGLDQYLEQTVFYRPRPFSREDFRKAMLALSQPKPDTLALACQLAEGGRYLMATINNESRDLNDYRIQTFGLREIFRVFVSSCYVGQRKPEEGIYRLALDLTQKSPQECCFVDDRALNLETAARLGMHTIQARTASQLRQEMEELRIEVPRLRPSAAADGSRL